MYKIERKNVRPYGFFELPAVADFTEKDWRLLDKISSKYEVETGDDGKISNHNAFRQSARVMAEFIDSVGEWDFVIEEDTTPETDENTLKDRKRIPYTYERFCHSFDKDHADSYVNFNYWLGSHLHLYKRLVTDPNDLAAS